MPDARYEVRGVDPTDPGRGEQLLMSFPEGTDTPEVMGRLCKEAIEDLARAGYTGLRWRRVGGA